MSKKQQLQLTIEQTKFLIEKIAKAKDEHELEIFQQELQEKLDEAKVLADELDIAKDEDEAQDEDEEKQAEENQEKLDQVRKENTEVLTNTVMSPLQDNNNITQKIKLIYYRKSLKH
jgi:phage repressor protein C with HTH and peptisase S24 domain